jgi:hypothetical protein
LLLLIYAHPHHQRSIANRVLLDAVRGRWAHMAPSQKLVQVLLVLAFSCALLLWVRHVDWGALLLVYGQWAHAEHAHDHLSLFAVLAIFSVMWRWNDFLLPLIVLSKSEYFTLQLALNSFQGELNTQWHYLLAMTVITLLPVTFVFAFLQKYITTGIASAGVK